MPQELTVNVSECVDQQIQTDAVNAEDLMCQTEASIDINK